MAAFLLRINKHAAVIDEVNLNGIILLFQNLNTCKKEFSPY